MALNTIFSNLSDLVNDYRKTADMKQMLKPSYLPAAKFSITMKDCLD